MELTTTFFTEGPRLTNETVPNQIHFPGYEFDPPFEQGYTIMIKTMKYKIKEGVAYIRDLFVPEAAATGTIKVDLSSVQNGIIQYCNSTDDKHYINRKNKPRTLLIIST